LLNSLGRSRFDNIRNGKDGKELLLICEKYYGFSISFERFDTIHISEGNLIFLQEFASTDLVIFPPNFSGNTSSSNSLKMLNYKLFGSSFAPI